MEKPILKLYYGRFCNIENIKVDGRKRDEYLDKLDDADRKIRERLEKEETLLNLYKTAMDSLEGVCSEEMACYYREAFRSGVLLVSQTRIIRTSRKARLFRIFRQIRSCSIAYDCDRLRQNLSKKSSFAVRSNFE